MGQTAEDREISIAARKAIGGADRYITSKKDFCAWEEKQFTRIMFFDKIVTGRYVGYCECGETVDLPTVKGGESGECPVCGRRVMYRSVRYPYYVDRKILSVLERHGDGLLQRIFVGHKRTCFGNDGVTTNFSEDEEGRYYFDFGSGKTVKYHMTAQKTKWSLGRVRVHGMGWSSWRADCLDTDTYASGGWNKILSFAPSVQYSALQIACERMRWQPLNYLEWYNREPRLESLLKIGLYGLANELTDFFGRNREQIRSLRSPKTLGIITAEDYRYCAWLSWNAIKARTVVKTWKIKEEDRTAARKFMENFREYHAGDFKYDFISNERLFTYWTEASAKKAADDNPAVFIRDYDDYVRECRSLNLNLADTAIRTPKNFLTMHARTSAEVKIKKNAELSRKIKSFYAKVHRLVEWTDGEYSVIMPSSAESIIREGKVQNHCVGGYCSRVAEGTSVILFIRKNSAKRTAFVTMEIKPNFEQIEIVQTRAKRNADPDTEVKRFLEKYRNWFNGRSAKKKTA